MTPTLSLTRRARWTGDTHEDDLGDLLFRVGILDHWLRKADGRALQAFADVRELLDEMEADARARIGEREASELPQAEARG